MKRTISLLSVIALLLVNSGPLFAQSQNIPATATVEQEISLTLDGSPENSIDFGTVSQNTTPTLDPNGSNSSVGNGAGIAELDINASASTSIYISWNTTTTLTDATDGSNSMSLTADIDGSTSNDTPGGSTDITNGNSVTTDGSGNYYLFIGGSITVASTQSVDSYSTANTNGVPLTVTVNY